MTPLSLNVSFFNRWWSDEGLSEKSSPRTLSNPQFATAPKGGEAMVDFILEVEELEERIAPGGYTGAGS